ncbi:MAG: hypothetical protein RR666_00895, partial [Raoultibacter sp.]
VLTLKQVKIALTKNRFAAYCFCFIQHFSIKKDSVSAGSFCVMTRKHARFAHNDGILDKRQDWIERKAVCVLLSLVRVTLPYH